MSPSSAAIYLGHWSATPWVLTILVLAIAGATIARMRARIGALVLEVDRATKTDPLTGLLNRHAFDVEFDLELERSRRSARPMSLMVADLDHFKEVNDKQGHHAGDVAIERFAAILDGAARRVDVAVRLGGEEFGLLLPGTDEAGAYMLAERLRVVVREAFRTEMVPLTISFGIASYPAHGYEAECLMGAADHALYTAKALGRNRTVICNRAIASAIATEVDRPAAHTGRAAA